MATTETPEKPLTLHEVSRKLREKEAAESLDQPLFQKLVADTTTKYIRHPSAPPGVYIEVQRKDGVISLVTHFSSGKTHIALWNGQNHLYENKETVWQKLDDKGLEVIVKQGKDFLEKGSFKPELKEKDPGRVRTNEEHKADMIKSREAKTTKETIVDDKVGYNQQPTPINKEGNVRKPATIIT